MSGCKTQLLKRKIEGISRKNAYNLQKNKHFSSVFWQILKTFTYGNINQEKKKKIINNCL